MSDVEVAWPLVHANDDGIRPAGKADHCFFCNQKVGTEHKRNCVVVKKKVKMRFSFEMDVEMPHSWKQEDIEFYFNGSSSCADNIIRILERYSEEHGCVCDIATAEFLGKEDTTPIRKINH